MNRKELFMKKRKIATILLAACLLLGNVSVANAASIDNVVFGVGIENDTEFHAVKFAGLEPDSQFLAFDKIFILELQPGILVAVQYKYGLQCCTKD